jgi:hypothetical protein
MNGMTVVAGTRRVPFTIWMASPRAEASVRWSTAGVADMACVLRMWNESFPDFADEFDGLSHERQHDIPADRHRSDLD